MSPSQNQASHTARLLNLAILAIVLVLGFVSFFSFLELLITVAVSVVSQVIESDLRRHYTLVMLRNVWLVVGAILVVSLIVGCSVNFGKSLGERRGLRWPLRILALEVVVIGLTILVTGRII